MPTALSTTRFKAVESQIKDLLNRLQSTANPQLVHVDISPDRTLCVGPTGP